MPKKFMPLNFNFVKLDLQHGNLCFYEYCAGEFCDGKMDPHRLNLYLTQDGCFVTIWHGLFDAAFIDQKFHEIFEQAGVGEFDFEANYNTPLLRGYIELEDEAKIILKALRYDQFMPSIIRIDEDNRLTFDNITI